MYKTAQWMIMVVPLLSAVVIVCVDWHNESRDRLSTKDRESIPTEGSAPTGNTHLYTPTIRISDDERQLVTIKPPRPDAEDQKILAAILDEGMTQRQTKALLKISHISLLEYGNGRYKVISYKSPIVPDKAVDVVYERHETTEFMLASWKCRTSYSARFRQDLFLPVVDSDRVP